MSPSYSLYIDTTNPTESRVSIRQSKTSKSQVFTENGRSQTILPAIKSALSQTHCAFDQVSDIAVHTGPGSFTGVRVGVAVAKIIGLLLGISVNGHRAWDTIGIVYEKDRFAGPKPQD